MTDKIENSSTEKPQQKFYVHVRQDWTYCITAESPEAAAADFEYDPPRDGDCTGYSIESVTLDNNPTGDDLRADVPCRGCGKSIPAYESTDECVNCLLARIKRERSTVVAAPVGGTTQ